jgi:hypothetical protein
MLLAVVFAFEVLAKVAADMAELPMLQNYNILVRFLYNSDSPGLSDCTTEQRGSGDKENHVEVTT